MKNVRTPQKKFAISAVFALVAMALIAPIASAQWTQAGAQVFATSGTNVGVGTSSPAPYTINATNTANAFFQVKSTNTGGGAGTSLAGFIMDRGNINSGSSLNFRTGGADNWILGIGIYAAGTDFQLGDQATPKLTMTTAGNLGIGTIAPSAKLDVVGNLKVSGSITGGSVIGAVYQDVAEWVPTTSEVSPGTVVVLNPSASNEVMPSGHAYDTMVAGVVSAHPGVILGKEGEGKAQIATTGRVHVQVDAKTTGIKVGDLLVTSDEAGVAMRSEPMTINGRMFHQPGTILGKALEPLASGKGEILVLLSLQ